MSAGWLMLVHCRAYSSVVNPSRRSGVGVVLDAPGLDKDLGLGE
jgi:hypothetical protein